MIKKNKRFLAITLFSCLILLLTPEANAASISWMKPGSYAEYHFTSVGIQLINGTITQYGLPKLANFSWICSGFSGNLAELNVSLSLSNDTSVQTFSSLVLVNVNTRMVFLENGTELGITRLWAQANPQDGESVALWSADVKNSSNIYGIVRSSGSTGTLQGYQELYQLYGSGKIRGLQTIVDVFFDKDSGILVDGYLDTEPTLYALGINNPYRNGTQTLVSTNIDLGASTISPVLVYQYGQWIVVLLFAVLVTVFVILSFIIYRLRSGKKGRYNRKRVG